MKMQPRTRPGPEGHDVTPAKVQSLSLAFIVKNPSERVKQFELPENSTLEGLKIKCIAEFEISPSARSCFKESHSVLQKQT